MEKSDSTEEPPISSFTSSLDSRLIVSLPKIYFLGNAKSRKSDGEAQFIVLMRVDEDVIMRTFEMDERPNNVKTFNEKQEKVSTYYLQILCFNKKSQQPFVKTQLKINKPVHWSSHDVRAAPTEF